jgi:hypothetical protein
LRHSYKYAKDALFLQAMPRTLLAVGYSHCYPRAMPEGLYVELPMRTEMERLWRLTQDPALHQRWDLRFSTIRYLAKPDEEAPQQFLYETRIGFGLAVAGEGESTGTRSGTTGERTPHCVSGPTTPSP